MKTLQMRIAFRVEGTMWNAYWADQDTMNESLLIGSIRLAVVQKSPALKARFVDLMQAVVSEAFQAVVGRAPEWLEPHEAPAHEKAGSS